MRKLLALILTLALLLPMMPAMGTVAKAESAATTEQVSEKPFYGLTWSPVDMELFGNLLGKQFIQPFSEYHFKNFSKKNKSGTTLQCFASNRHIRRDSQNIILHILIITSVK